MKVEIPRDLAEKLLAMLVAMDDSSFHYPHFFDLRTVQEGIAELRKAVAEPCLGSKQGGFGDECV